MTFEIPPFSRRCAWACLLAVVLPVAGVRAADGTEPKPDRRTPDAAQVRRVQSSLAALPMRFEPNLERVAGPVDFIARGRGYAVLISRLETTLLLHPASSAGGTTVRTRLGGGSHGAPGVGLHPLPGVSNQMSGRDARRWRTGVRGFGRVEYRDVYPGVNVVYYGNQQQLEYDFLVQPGANVRRIDLTFEGADRVAVDSDGHLILTTAAGDLVHQRPTIYQQRPDGTRSTIEGGYVIRSGGHVGFRIGKHDRRLALVIDPVLTYSTYLGGSTGGENPYAIAVDRDDNIYVAGETSSLDFPSVNGLPPTPGGYYFLDAFVAKLNAAGTVLIYATFLGGSQPDTAADVAVDASGNAYIAGYTFSPDFPTLNAIQATLKGASDAFVTKLNPSGGLVYSTYLGGKEQEIGFGIAVDASDRAFVTGYAMSPDFPVVSPMQSTLGGSPALRTIDGGETWQAVETGLPSLWVRAFAIDPTDHAKLYAVAVDGMFKSVDGGDSWVRIAADLPSGLANAIVIAPTDPPTVYAGTEAGVFRSTDDGTSWTHVWSTMSFVTALVVDPSSPTTIFATQRPGFNVAGVFKSVDSGDSWVDTGLHDDPELLAMSGSTLYTGGINGVSRKIAGAGWTRVFVGEVRALAVDPINPWVVYAGGYGGVFKTSSGGASWDLILPGGPITALAVAPSHPDVVYAATESDGMVWSADAGATWNRVYPSAFFVSTLLVDPQNPSRAYAGSFVPPDAFVSILSAGGSTLEYSTYLGGAGWDFGNDVAVDILGSAYLVGTTTSRDFPTPNGIQTSRRGSQDVFVAKLAATGELAYGTYLGGTEYQDARTIGVDAAGQAYIAGQTYSPDFPVVNAHQSTLNGLNDLFVTTLNASGDGLVYSTFLGGANNDLDAAIAVSPSGIAVVTGVTSSSNFPTLNAVQSVLRGWSDAAVAKFGSDGQLLYSTFLGGASNENGRRVAIDSTGAAVVLGSTDSSDFPTKSALQPTMAGPSDLFISRIADGVADTIAPTTTIERSGTTGLAGWYRSEVVVALSAVDNADGTGVATIEASVDGGPFQPYAAPFTVTTQGSTDVRARAADNAGNVETPGVSAAIRIDTMAPALVVTSPQAGAYLHSDTLTVGFAATDPVSGVAGGSPSASLDGMASTNGQTIPLLTLSLGQHALVAFASDVAGNAAQQSVTFTIVATVDSVIAAVNTFTVQGAVDAGSKKTLLSKLNDAKTALGRGNVTAARNKLRDVIDYATTQSGKGIAPAAATVIVADTEYVLGTL